MNATPAIIDELTVRLEWIRVNLAAFVAGAAALDPDGYPTGGDRRGRGVADPTGHAAQASKPGREARRVVAAELRAAAHTVRRVEATMRPVLDQVPPVEIPAGEQCLCCGRWVSGRGDDRLRPAGVTSARWCDACRRAWERRAGTTPLAEFIAERRDRETIGRKRRPA